MFGWILFGVVVYVVGLVLVCLFMAGAKGPQTESDFESQSR